MITKFFLYEVFFPKYKKHTLIYANKNKLFLFCKYNEEILIKRFKEKIKKQQKIDEGNMFFSWRS